jgi:dTDP-4-amino-4,6-dideoxygalactose transaminase
MAISNTATNAVRDRIQSISYQGKQVVLVDFSNCSAVEVEKIARAVPDYVTAQPLGSVLLLVDFTGASFDQDAVRAMKESAVFDKPYIKKSTWVGAGNLPHAFEKDLKAFSRREFPTFKTREEALKWLAGD